ncbi:MAG: hypothetical protein DIJKHBIC_00831 [Thermoanaerobaculia bacterium]|nr:hypothetical protein [Thermoanaerobaculia bacterium]
MLNQLLRSTFDRIGARVQVRNAVTPPSFRPFAAPVDGFPLLDVLHDRRGEYFDIRFLRGAPPADLLTIDVRPESRHLLLLARSAGLGRQETTKLKFLCGHDERHWFVASVPANATTVRSAMEALQPEIVRRSVVENRVRTRDRLRRRNPGFVRQGEWFFVPRPDLSVDERRVLRYEPLSRVSGSKPHVVEFCYRTGGETVHVHSLFAPSGIHDSAFRNLRPECRTGPGWRVMQRVAAVYAKGKVRHSDHSTVNLGIWHEVALNTESTTASGTKVVFLD